MSTQTLSTMLTKMPMPKRILRIDNGMELYMVEDVNGQPIAYSQSSRIARLIFAAPGLLTAMERLGDATQKMVEDARQDHTPQPGQRFLDALHEALDDANVALIASLSASIDSLDTP